MIKVKRVYDLIEDDDGQRILVDRLWPRGVKKKEVKIDVWMKELAPGHRLREWFGHNPERWVEFKEQYRQELTEKGKEEALKTLIEKAKGENITLLYAAKDREHNNALALKEVIESWVAY